MKLMLDINIQSPPQQVTYRDRIFLIGSCFTEHIGKRLEDLKFPVLQNPNGILFDPVSVSKSINSYIDLKTYGDDDLFLMNDLWQSWDHHSMFSGVDKQDVLTNINRSQARAHEQLKIATWLIVTLGSSFSYGLKKSQAPVANCHRAPAQWFNKNLLQIDETATRLSETIEKLQGFNPSLKIIFTISPVRHIRDGVVENNRSKARLIEAVHQLLQAFDHTYYYPAYELVIDVLRDYRFYDIDLVHPNYAATEMVFNHFEQSFIDTKTQVLMEEVRKVNTAFKHKPFHPNTNQHRSFLRSSLEKVLDLEAKLPHLNFEKEKAYFSKENDVTGSSL